MAGRKESGSDGVRVTPVASSVDRVLRAITRVSDRIRWRGERRTILRGPARGLRIATRHSSSDYAEGVNELPVQHTISGLLDVGDTFFDIGSNVGFFSLIAARRVGTGGRVVAFEAVPEIAETAALNARMNGFDHVDVRPVAVGASIEVARLQITDHPGGATIAGTAVPSEVTSEIDIEVVDIDTLMRDGRLPVPHVVKIDVEGHERPVIEGMRRTIAEHRPTIVIEIDAPDDDVLANKRRQIEADLAELGYGFTTLPESYVDTTWRVLHLLATPG